MSKTMTEDAPAPRSSLGHMPDGKWAFDGDVTDIFDDMLRRSIPQYDVMRDEVFRAASAVVERFPKLQVVDLGCSRGEALAPFIDKFGAYNRYVGVEVSKPMVAAARERFKGYVENGLVEIREHDLRGGFPPVSACVVLSVLTLQFTPIEHRQRILRDIHRHLTTGGALVLVEKVLGATAELNEAMVKRYYEVKREHGYTQDEIDRKRLALEGVLVPVTAHWNEELLRMAGFAQVDCFWRWHNFAGWIAVK